MMTAPITVTAHALVRWGSRVMGLDCAEHLRQDSKRVGHLRRNPAFQISAVEAEIKKIAEAALHPIFDPLEEVYIYTPRATIVVKQFAVVTIFEPGMLYEEGYYARRAEARAGKTSMAAAFGRAFEQKERTDGLHTP